jgi:hypothetical protein
MDFRTFYIRDAVDKVNAAESQLHIDDSTEEIIAVVNKIKRARAELRHREAETFKDEHDFVKHYDSELQTLIDMLDDSQNNVRIIALCDKICKANVKLYKARTLVSVWKALK